MQHVAKFFALGRGGDFCKLSVCQYDMQQKNALESQYCGSTENEIGITFFCIFHTIDHATKMLVFFKFNSLIPNKVKESPFSHEKCVQSHC